MATDAHFAAALPEAARQFHAVLREALARDALVKLTLGKYRGPEPDLRQVIIRRVAVKGEACLSFVYRYQTRDVTKNHPVAAGLGIIHGLLGQDFKSAHLQTLTEQVSLEFSRKGKCSVSRTAVASDAAPAFAHNREKARVLDPGRPFLTSLGVTNEHHQVLPAMSRKWKQINKFLEVFGHAFESVRETIGSPVRVVDFGAGKGYLTFAVYEYLHQGLGLAAEVTGVELRDDLVRSGNGVAEDLGLTGLRFRQGEVGNYAPAPLDVLIALHACDTATDLAIHLGLRAQAAIILCAPCCHRELRPQLTSPPVLQPLLRFGVHQAQEAEMVTDSLRALVLEASGYEAQVFEFISLEHTSKNKMILAVKRGVPDRAAEAWDRIAALKTFYGISEFRLETLVRAGMD